MLPDTVLDRLAPEVRARLTAPRTTRKGTKVDAEVRTIAQAPVFTDTDTGWNLRGYATVYDHAYPIAGGPEAGGWMEIVERGATAKSINDGADVRLLYDHGGIVLARTASGSMRLISDDNGMKVDADLDPDSPYAQSVRSAVTRGDADQMSFAFRVTRQSWNEDYTERRIKEVQLFDASVVSYPASEATVVQMNAGRPDVEKRDAEAEEDNIVEQIEALVARLIAGEAAELEAGGEASGALAALVDVLRALDWFETIDSIEDATPVEADDMPMRKAEFAAELARARAAAA